MENALHPRLVDKLRHLDVKKIEVNSAGYAAIYTTPTNLPLVDSLPLSKAFASAVNDQDYADVVFLVERQPIYAHRIILAQRCEFFRTMFASGMRESIQNEIPVPDVRREVFLLLLRYLYSERIKIKLDDLLDLFNLAHMYRLEPLQDLCCREMEENLTVGKAAEMLQRLTDCQCERLKDICMNYTIEHFSEVSESEGFKCIDRDLLVEIVKGRVLH